MYVFIYLFIYLLTYLFIFLFIYFLIHLFSYLFICFVYLFIYLSIYLFICFIIYLFIYLFIYSNLLLVCAFVNMCYNHFRKGFFHLQQFLGHTWEVRISNLELWDHIMCFSKFLHLRFWRCHISPPKTKLQQLSNWRENDMIYYISEIWYTLI